MAGYTLYFTFELGGNGETRNIASEEEARDKWANLKKNRDNPVKSGYIKKPDGTKIPLK